MREEPPGYRSPTTASVGGEMQIPKEQILEFLRSRGDDDKASQAEGELPDQVDTEQDSGMLSKYGIDVQDLMGALKGRIPGF
jgi:hypothetical protein